MSARKDETGNVYGHLTGLEYAGIQGGDATWLCRCACGAEIVVKGSNLRRGHTTSCNGADQPSAHTKEAQALRSAIARTTNPDHPGYDSYGGRGISVDPIFRLACGNLNYTAWWAALGPAPSPDHSVDRIDNDGNYEPGNLRWATKSQQQHNKRNSKANGRKATDRPKHAEDAYQEQPARDNSAMEAF